MTEKTKFRCAIYTRKSSEEGLDQDFNSIEAQREAGEAYVRSQAHEGWELVSDRFDDGGFSGGNMDRPALARLMTAIQAHQVDIVVIYKIDRLTRSLTDFGRLAETFDEHKVSFVSVTQQFNTTNSMGRLMLNVLLSFAQFEREITGERIRDKIAASKKKGMWMGGNVPIGYRVEDRRLLVNDEEVASVRTIFSRYIQTGSVPALLESLNDEGMQTAPRLSNKGQASGAKPFTRGHLYKLLSNPIYIGRVRHKAVSHHGQHEAIIHMATWNAVQAQLASNTQGPRTRRRRAVTGAPLLAGLLVGADGAKFIPTHANKGARRYHYYVEEVAAGCAARRLPNTQIERAVLSALSGYLQDHRKLAVDLEVSSSAIVDMLTYADTLANTLQKLGLATQEAVTQLVAKVVYRDTHLELQIIRDNLKLALGWPDGADLKARTNQLAHDDVIVVSTPLSMRRRGAQFKLTIEPNGHENYTPDRSLLTAVVRARDWAARIIAGMPMATLAQQEQVTDSYISQLLPLAFLAPSLVEDIVAGRHPMNLTADKLIWKTQLPLSWNEQLAVLSK